LPLVAAKVQNFKGAEVLLTGLLLALNAYQALARRVNGKFAKIRVALRLTPSFKARKIDSLRRAPYDFRSPRLSPLSALVAIRIVAAVLFPPVINEC
jgi:hypothetical protein